MRDGLIGLLLLAAVGLVVYGCFLIHASIGYIVSGMFGLGMTGLYAIGRLEHEKPTR